MESLLTQLSVEATAEAPEWIHLDSNYKVETWTRGSQDLGWPRLMILCIALSGAVVIFVKTIGNAAETGASSNIYLPYGNLYEASIS